MRREETRKMFARKFWRFDSRHVEHKTVEQKLNLPPILLIAAHAATRNHGTADAETSTADYWKGYSCAPSIVVRTESVEAVRSFVANQQGIITLSDMMYRPWSLEDDGIEVREVETDIPMMQTGVVWPSELPLSTGAETFLGFCRMDSDLLRSQAHRAMPPPSA